MSFKRIGLAAKYRADWREEKLEAQGSVKRMLKYLGHLPFLSTQDWF